MSTPYFHHQAIEAFNQMHVQAFWNRARNALIGQSTHLPAFEASVPRHLPRRQYLGVQTISIENITGSLGRAQEFGPGFRPLKRSTRERWVKIFVLAREDRWEPVHLIKVGAQYFVEDGNHRVSVANYLGRSFIDAEVWEYPVIPTLTLQSHCVHCGQLIMENI